MKQVGNNHIQGGLHPYPSAAETLVTKVFALTQYPNNRRQNCNLLHVISIISIFIKRQIAFLLTPTMTKMDIRALVTYLLALVT